MKGEALEWRKMDFLLYKTVELSEERSKSLRL
jgi:hypothetical protein